jgi:hypothetical protein
MTELIRRNSLQTAAAMTSGLGARPGPVALHVM